MSWLHPSAAWRARWAQRLADEEELVVPALVVDGPRVLAWELTADGVVDLGVTEAEGQLGEVRVEGPARAWWFPAVNPGETRETAWDVVRRTGAS